MADQQSGVWGIDIGQCALKAVRLEVVDDQVTATAFDYVEHSKILSQPDADPDQLTREALEKFLSRNDLHGDVVAISVPGQSGLARFVKLPPVEEKKIPDIVRFEAKQQIPFPLDEVVWDYQKIGSGNVTDGFAMETEIGLFAIKRDMVNRAMQQFKDVDVEVHIIQMAPLALCNFLAFDLLGKGGPSPGDEDAEERTSEKRCVVGLDIGTDNSNLVITDGERIIWQRPIPFGGNHFTRALTKDLKLTFAKAEHLKRNATKSPDLKKILTSLKPVLNDFVNEVQRSLGYFTNTHRNAQVAYMVGLGNAFRLPGLQKFLSEKLQLDVRKLQKMERLSGETVTTAPAFTQNILSFATAYGLAVQGLKTGRLTTNLLPKDIQFERMVRAKKPWALAGAAALFLGLMGPTVYYAMQYRAVAAEAITNEIDKQDKPLVTKVSADNSEFTRKEGEVKKQEDAVRNIIAGQEERLNWMLLNEFINACVPVPGQRIEGKLTGAQGQQYEITDREGKKHTFNINETTILKGTALADPRELKPDDSVAVIYNDRLMANPNLRKYWTADARYAYLQFIERQATGKKAGDQGAGEGVENLIQVNIESVYPLFCGDLKGYFEQLRKDMTNRELPRMLSKERNEKLETGPDGKGWVVEIRGYTYYHSRQGTAYDFLLDTLHHNLSTMAVLKDPLAKKEPAAPAAEKTPAAAPGAKVGRTVAEPAKDTQDKAAAKALTPEEEKARKWHTVMDMEETPDGKDGGPRVSYVVLYDYQPSDDTTGFKLINSSWAAGLIANAASAQPAAAAPGGGGAAGGAGGAAQRAMPGGDSSSGGGGGRAAGQWQPLVEMGLGSGSNATEGAMARRPAAAPSPGGLSSGAATERPGGVPVPGAQPTEPTTKASPKRTEFVMLFIWKEPTPSDAITGTEGAAAGVAAPAGGRKSSGRGAPPVGAPPVAPGG
jgi:type IV pilus assembly protein PilM